MKNQFFLLIFVFLCCTLWGQRNWSLYTNTTHMRDLVVYDGNIVIATWGGLEFFDTRTNSFVNTITTFDGMSGNNARTLSTFGSRELLIGINGQGIDRIINNRFDVALTESSGLPSVRFNAIYTHDNTIYIGSESGLTLFENEENFPFPLFKNNFSIINGLPFRVVYDIVADASNYLFLGTNVGFSRVHVDSLSIRNSWKHFPLNQDESVHSIDTKGIITALATSQRLIYFGKNDLENRENWNILYPDTLSFSKVLIDEADYTIFAIFGSWEEQGNHYEPDAQSRSVAIIPTPYTLSPTPYPLSEDIILHFGAEAVFHRAVSNILLHENKIFVTTWGGGIYFYDKNISSNISDPVNWHNFTPNSIHTNTIVDIAVENYKIWIIDGITHRTGSSTAATGVSFLDKQTDTWTHYNVHNSQLVSDNITAIGIDAQNRKWFGAWWTSPPGTGGSWNGITVLDDSNPQNPIWHRITTATHPTLINPTISSILRVGDTMWLSSAANNPNNDPGGVNIFNSDVQVSGRFQPPRMTPFFNITAMHQVGNLSYFGSENSGLRIWTSNSIPESEGNFWQTPPALNSGRVFKIATYVGANFTQTWFAHPSSPPGVIWNEVRNNQTTWYKSTSASRKERYENGSWNPSHERYFEGEERIFGAEAATPSSVVVDPLGRVWIGSSDKGITMYDIYRNTFTNFNDRNSPLTTNNILSLAYQQSTGLLLIGTSEGLLTTQISRSEKIEEELGNVSVFPNPFRPETGETLSIQIINTNSLPRGRTEARIFDVNGQLITVLEESLYFNGFLWDGNNSNREKVSSGIYFYLIHSDIGDSERGRIVLIR